jgi:homocysteine S-methyltransferase
VYIRSSFADIRVYIMLKKLLEENKVVITDGALATELEARGANLNHSLWSAKLLTENPGLIKQVHYDYLLAGAKIITSASYQASFEGFANHGYTAAQAADLMRLSVTLAMDARNEALQTGAVTGYPLVAASVGPYGASLADGSEYRGDYGLSIEALKEFHRPRIEVLANSGADLLACETIPCLEEGAALVEVMKEFPHMPYWLSFSCKDEEHVCSGQPFAECAVLANSSDNMVAIGINCTPPQFVASLVRIAHGVTVKPIVVYPNKGETWDAVHKCWLPGEGHTDFAEEAKRWQQAGATIIGGCCRTSPGDIRRLSELLLEP